MPLIVQKFGGTSVADSQKILAAARKAIRAQRDGNQVVMVVSAMGKKERRDSLFDRLKRENALNLFLTYYFMAAHPGCTQADMGQLRAFAEKRLRLLPEQAQIFTPTPATWSTLMYYTEKDPFTGEGLFVEKNRAAKDRQKAAVSPGSAGAGDAACVTASCTP